MERGEELLAPSGREVAREWASRSMRDGLARVMRASQPEELNEGVTRETARVLGEFAETARREMGRPPASALEVGCGIGRLTPTVAELAQHVTAVDMTPRMLDLARERCASLDNVEFRTGRAEQRPWGEARFDIGVSVWVLMHVLDEEGIAAACRSLAESCRYLVLIEYERAHVPVSKWSRLRGLDEYLALMPGARVVRRTWLDYGGDRSVAALLGFHPAS
ncbi:methyltransferase family protein [Haloactinospora alba]|uniref:Methyltransferase family protein n=1 Tax=Haloactinospora alba TaxID=405555 RepID=A0A543NEN9_9ACTN|nr:class I SAM-dependent methyltransferase [Haloactinospora alba]TQN30291.1 methyltransferase family protein [Haloactinospora alba]